MVEKDELLRTYYYHCLPYQSNPPTDEEKRRYARKHRFVTALRHLPRHEVRLGKLVFRGNTTDGQPIFQQKRVDIMLGVDMALLAGKRRMDRVALLTGDSDTIPAVEAVKTEGVLVTLWHGKFGTNASPSRDLVKIVDERCEISDDVVKRIAR